MANCDPGAAGALAIAGGPVRSGLDRGFDPRTAFIFIGSLAVGLLFVRHETDLAEPVKLSAEHDVSVLPVVDPE